MHFSPVFSYCLNGETNSLKTHPQKSRRSSVSATVWVPTRWKKSRKSPSSQKPQRLRTKAAVKLHWHPVVSSFLLRTKNHQGEHLSFFWRYWTYLKLLLGFFDKPHFLFSFWRGMVRRCLIRYLYQDLPRAGTAYRPSVEKDLEVTDFWTQAGCFFVYFYVYNSLQQYEQSILWTFLALQLLLNMAYNSLEQLKSFTPKFGIEFFTELFRGLSGRTQRQGLASGSLGRGFLQGGFEKKKRNSTPLFFLFGRWYGQPSFLLEFCLDDFVCFVCKIFVCLVWKMTVPASFFYVFLVSISWGRLQKMGRFRNTEHAVEERRRSSHISSRPASMASGSLMCIWRSSLGGTSLDWKNTWRRLFWSSFSVFFQMPTL